MIKRFRIFLGPSRFRVFLALLALTGLASLALSVMPQLPWSTAAQSLLLLIFVAGAGYLLLSRLPREERWRWLAIIVPAALAALIASIVFPHLTGLFLGAGLGWIVAGIFIFNSPRGPQHVKRAIKLMRKGDFQSAIAEMTAQIQQEPRKSEHYRFRAELHRLAGALGKARRDYQTMIELDDGAALAYNGLAEVELQARNYQKALTAARQSPRAGAGRMGGGL